MFMEPPHTIKHECHYCLRFYEYKVKCTTYRGLCDQVKRLPCTTAKEVNFGCIPVSAALLYQCTASEKSPSCANRFPSTRWLHASSHLGYHFWKAFCSMIVGFRSLVDPGLWGQVCLHRGQRIECVREELSFSRQILQTEWPQGDTGGRP